MILYKTPIRYDVFYNSFKLKNRNNNYAMSKSHSFTQSKKKNRRKNDKILIFKKILKENKKMIGLEILTLIVGAVLGIVLAPYLLPQLHEKPSINIQVFQSHAPYGNGTNVRGITWNSQYKEYIIMIQTNAKGTSLEDIYLILMPRFSHHIKIKSRA